MKQYCRECGSLVHIRAATMEKHCVVCNTKLSFKDMISEDILNVRILQLKAMNQLMRNANDETITETWLMLGVPDGSSEDDFFSIALQDEDYNEIFDLFVKLIAKKGVRY